jgi:predicted membrane protein
MKFDDKDLPGLFQSADTASIKEQKKFFNGIFWYLTLLIIAALFAFFADDYPNPIFKIISTVLFLLTLFIMIW